jgi:hypothetical protein
MFGRGICLLAISTAVLVSLLSPVVVFGQVNQDGSRLQVPPIPLSDRIPSLPLPVPTIPEPVAPPRLPVTRPGGFGFPQFARAAGMIFSGTVTKVEPRPATPASGHAVTTVAITFHVENAIRGATPGQELTISQWIGAWSSGQRYRVGERVLLFLYPPSKLGLTSCVGGAMGHFVVDPQGRVLLTAQHLAAFRTDSVLGGKSRVYFSDFALAVKRLAEEE